MAKTELPTLYVDFNEMLENDLVLLSKTDLKINPNGERHNIREGMDIEISDCYAGDREYLIAKGKAELNKDNGWSAHVKWCCRINKDGIQNVDLDG